MQRKLTDEGFSIHGEMLRCERVHPSNSIQVNVIAANGDSVDEDVIKSHFCNHTLSPLGTTDTMIVDKRGDNVFTVTFPSDQRKSMEITVWHSTSFVGSETAQTDLFLFH